MPSASSTAVEPRRRGAASSRRAAAVYQAMGPNGLKLAGHSLQIDTLGENIPRTGAWCRRCQHRHLSGAPSAVVARCGGELVHRPRITWRSA